MLLCRLAWADLPRMLLLPALLRKLADEAGDGDASDDPGDAVSSCNGVDVLLIVFVLDESGCATLSADVTCCWSSVTT